LPGLTIKSEDKSIGVPVKAWWGHARGRCNGGRVMACVGDGKGGIKNNKEKVKEG